MQTTPAGIRVISKECEFKLKLFKYYDLKVEINIFYKSSFSMDAR